MKKWLLVLGLLFPFLAEGQVITTVAGTGSSTFSGESMPAISAGTPNPAGGAFDKNGNYYFADVVNSHRIRKINVATGIITTVAGNGSAGFSGDGLQATSANLNRPHAMQFDTSGNFYIVDQVNSRIRKVNGVSGIISTIAGNGTFVHGGDGASALGGTFVNPQDIAIDKKGNIYIADLDAHRIRKVDASGIIWTFAGTGTLGFSGDGGPATVADLGYPSGLALDDTGNLYIADASSLVLECVK